MVGWQGGGPGVAGNVPFRNGLGFRAILLRTADRGRNGALQGVIPRHRVYEATRLL